MEEYIETAKFLTREYKGKQLYGIIPQLARGVGNHAEWANLMFALGGDYYDSNWNVTVNKGGALQAAEYLLDIYQNTAPVGSTGYSFDEVFSAVAESKGAMLLTYGWMLAGLNDPAKSQVAGKVEMTVVPGGHGVGGGWGWAIPHNSENKDAAWSFLSWVESFEIAKKRALEGGAPTRFDVFDDPQVMAEYPKLSVMREIVASGRPMPIMASTNKSVDVLAREISEVTSGTKSVKEAMDAAALMLAEFVEDDPLVQK